MSHLHLPDGVLPVALVAGGWGLTLLALARALRPLGGEAGRHVLPRVGFLAALMALAMSLELPIGYHVNLSVVAGILLGPAAGFVAAFLTVLLLALVGHGGITVVGLNALLLGSEVVVGGWLFARWRPWGAGPAAFLATVVALWLSASLMLGVVALARLQPTLALEGELPRHVKTFAAWVYGLGVWGWLLEGVITAGIARYLARVRPALVAGGTHGP